MCINIETCTVNNVATVPEHKKIYAKAGLITSLAIATLSLLTYGIDHLVTGVETRPHFIIRVSTLTLMGVSIIGTLVSGILWFAPTTRELQNDNNQKKPPQYGAIQNQYKELV